MSLDGIVSRMVMRARQFERALHDPGPWTVHVDGVETKARKVVGDDHVTFFSIVNLAQHSVAELRCGGEVVAVKDLPGVGKGQVRWSFQVDELRVAA
jgi:hypothetical protein